MAGLSPWTIGLTAATPVIVVVEDDDALRSALCFSLGVEGFATQSFASGEALLKARLTTGCSCFIVDHLLPGMSGLDLLDALRGAEGLTAPAILITSNPSAVVHERARRSGVKIVKKPLLDDDVLTTVRELMRAQCAGD